MTARIAVVTAVTGGYDYARPHAPAAYLPDVDYLFFGDGTVQPADPQWQVHQLDPGLAPDVWRLAKVPKVAPHLLPELVGYQYVVWIDGDMTMRRPGFVPELLTHLQHHDLVLSPHFDYPGRDCCYGEAQLGMTLPRYQHEDIAGQVATYQAIGFPEHFGLWECGVQARRITADTCAFGDVWWGEILAWSVQDQISCGYALWSTGLDWAQLPRSWRDYGWLDLSAHTRDPDLRPTHQPD